MRRASRAFLLACLAAAAARAAEGPAGPAGADGGEQVLPMASRALPLVAGTAGRREALCLVDTGCTVTVIVHEAAMAWGLPLKPLAAPSSSFGFAGAIAVTHEAELEGLRLGGWAPGTIRAPAAALGPEPMGLALLVGQDRLRSRCALFDAQRQEIRLLDPDADVAKRLQDLYADRAWTRLPLAWQNGVPVVSLPVAGRPRAEAPLRMVLDTGAGSTSIRADAARRLRLAQAGETGGPGGRPAAIHELPGLRIGSWDCAALAVAHPGLFTDGILGFDLLSRFPFAVDGKGSVLWVAGPPKGEPARIRESYEDPAVRSLTDPHPRMRKARLDGLAEGGDPFLAPLVAELLWDPDPAVADSAAVALRALTGMRWDGPRRLEIARAWWKGAWAGVAKALAEGTVPEDRRIAAAAAGKMGRRSLAPFAAIWLSDGDAAVRAEAATALARLSGERWPEGEPGVEAARAWWKARADDPAFRPAGTR